MKLKVITSGSRLNEDGISFNIENPNATINSDIQGWNWVANGAQEVTTFGQNGTWTASDFQGNNPCDIFSNLLFDLSLINDQTDAKEIWSLLQGMKSLLGPNLKKELNLNGPFGYVILSNGSLVFNSENDEWRYYSTGSLTEMYGLRGEEANSYTGTTSGQNIINSGCNIRLESTSSFNLDPAVITLSFNTLSYCNIDALKGQ